MTTQNLRVMSAPPEVWDISKGYSFTNAYLETGRKPMFPKEDFINLTGTTAEKLYYRGMRSEPIHPSKAALPVFRIEIMNIGNDFSKILDDMLFPVYNPNTDRELGIYGLSLLFSTDAAQIACDIGFHYGDHSGGGYEDIGTVSIMADGDYFFSMPCYMNATAYDDYGLYDYTSITTLCNWLGYLWRGIQDQFINRPERIGFYHHRIKQSTERVPAESHTNKARVAKVQRIITIFLDEDDEIEITAGSDPRKINLSLWSVAGHWRVTKSGKRVWIAPYYKGKDRDKQDAQLQAKEYRFLEEVIKNA